MLLLAACLGLDFCGVGGGLIFENVRDLGLFLLDHAYCWYI